MTSISKKRSHSCFLAAATVVVLAISVPARPVAAQQAYPERGLVLIVPYPAGGGTDVTARLLARDLEIALGKPVTVENRAGGGGWLGWGALAAAPADGYTIGYLNVPSLYAGYLDPKVGRKESLDSFTPLTNHVLDYNVWAVKTDSAFKDARRRHRRREEGARENRRHRIRRRWRRSSCDPLDPGRNRRQVRHRPHARHGRCQDPGAGRARAGAGRQHQRGRRGRAGRAAPGTRGHGTRALPLSARRSQPSRSRASTRSGRSHAASRRRQGCPRTWRQSSSAT